jgi:hypothetical protein
LLCRYSDGLRAGRSSNYGLITDISALRSVQIGFGADPPSNTIRTGGYFPGGKAAGA